jgi:basic membrane protein A and related proteins
MIVNEIAGSYSLRSRKNCPVVLQSDTFPKTSPTGVMPSGALRLAAVAALLLGVAAGCSPRDQSKVRPAGFRVALLTPGPVSDAGWNAAAFDGLQLIKAHLGAETALVQTTSPADFEDAFRDFAGRGFNLIFAHGFEYTDAALKVAKLFPKTIFVVTSGSGSSQNVASLTFKIEEAAYVEGVIAGVVSKTGVVGAVGGIELPAIRLTFDGFRRGFHSVRPGGRVLVSYIGSFEDVGAAKEAALAQISQGADLIFHNADAAGLGVFQAASQAHIFAFGANRNQNDVAPEVVLASAVTDIPQAFLKIAGAVKAAEFHPAMIEFEMRDEMVKVVMNPRLISRIPARALELARASEDQIKGGKITFPSPAPAASAR